jgi:hypothetical protein
MAEGWEPSDIDFAKLSALPAGVPTNLPANESWATLVMRQTVGLWEGQARYHRFEQTRKMLWCTLAWLAASFSLVRAAPTPGTARISTAALSAAGIKNDTSKLMIPLPF